MNRNTQQHYLETDQLRIISLKNESINYYADLAFAGDCIGVECL